MAGGIPLLVVHGGPGLAHNYLFDYFSQLSDDYQIIFYDQRSCGLSSGEDFVVDLTMTNFVEDIEAIRKKFNIIELNLIGQSFGGLIALSYGVKYPNNLSSLLILESAAVNKESDANFELNINERMSDLDRDQLSKYDKVLEKSNFKSEIMINYFNILFKTYFFDQKYLMDLSFDYLTDKMVEKLFISASGPGW